MAVNVSVQYSGGLLPDIILLTQCYYHRGTPFKRREEVLYLQPMIPPKCFDIFPPDWGMLRRSRRVLLFLQTHKNPNLINIPTYTPEIQEIHTDTQHTHTAGIDRQVG
ncbi:unnamed protein product, partial [Ascophyllum nodosum]